MPAKQVNYLRLSKKTQVVWTTLSTARRCYFTYCFSFWEVWRTIFSITAAIILNTFVSPERNILNHRLNLGWKWLLDIRIHPNQSWHQSWHNIKVQSDDKGLVQLRFVTRIKDHPQESTFIFLPQRVGILLAIACVHCLSFLAVHPGSIHPSVLPNHTCGSWG